MTDALSRFSLAPLSRRLFFSLFVAFGVHAAIVLALPRGAAKRAMLAIAPPVDLDVAREPEEVREAPREPEPTRTESRAPAPAPHRAPRVLVRNDGPRDGDPIANGEDDSPRGGKVSSSSEIDGPPAIGSVSPTPIPPPPPVTPPPPPPPPPSIDRSRVAALSGSTEWSCPWPDEAEDIDVAVVSITVTIDATGRALKVDVVDPGHGFGREARRCALQRSYVPALDRDGRPITSTTKPIRVRFAR